MARQLTRRALERWLIDNGFIKEPRLSSGHAYFAGHGIKVTVPAHGPKDLTKKVAGHLRRQLRSVGLNPEW